MRGTRRMIAIVTSSVATLLCQGCSHVVVSASSEPAVAPTYSMLLATGGTNGRGASEGISLRAEAGQTAVQQRAMPSMALPVAAVGPIAASEFSHPAPNLSIDGSAYRPAIGFDSAQLSSTSALQQVSAGLVAARLSPSFEVTRNFGGELTLSAPGRVTGLPVDLGFSPRASIREEGGLTTRRVGAEVRLGEGLDERGEGSSARSWYFFAGADGEAICWDVGDKGFTTSNSLRLRDQVTVGDIQAGVSMNTFGGQLSLSYIRREVEYRDASELNASESEDFAGISFTLRR